MCTLKNFQEKTGVKKPSEVMRSVNSTTLYPGCMGGEKIILLPLVWPRYKVTWPLYFPLETTRQSPTLTPTREDNLFISTHLGTHLLRKSRPEREGREEGREGGKGGRQLQCSRVVVSFPDSSFACVYHTEGLGTRLVEKGKEGERETAVCVMSISLLYVVLYPGHFVGEKILADHMAV